MKKGYHDYVPTEVKEKEEKPEKDTTGTVTKCLFELQFGTTYPKAYNRASKIGTVPYPKNLGANGKTSRRHG